jgi:hypothetical protein
MQVARLERELEEIRSTPPAIVNPPRTRALDAPVGVAESPGSEESVAARLKDPEFKEAVKKAVADARKEEMEAMGRMWTNRAAQREKDMVDRFAEEQGLSDYQRDELTKIVTSRRERLSPQYRAMFTPPAEGETRDMAKIQKEMEKVRADSDEALKSLLTIDQFDAFKKQEESRRGRWGMGGGRSNRNSNDNRR